MWREGGKKQGIDLQLQVDWRWVCAASWFWKLVLEASEGLVVRTFAHDADVLLRAIN